MPGGFEHYSTDVLLITYRNLLKGIDRVAEILERDKRDGTTIFTDNPDTKGGTPPAEAGNLILILLQSVAVELLSRDVALPRDD